MARDVNLLTPEARQKALDFVSFCEMNGLYIKITDTLRSKEEQDALYEQGRTKPGSIVTNCKYPRSMHNWGIAFDFCRNDGKGAYNDSDGFFSKVGKLAEQFGLEWGGNWKSFKDKPHLQLPGWGSTPTKLIAQFGSPSNYLASIGASNKYLGNLENGSRGYAVKIIQYMLFDGNEAECDGIFGSKTCVQVKKFQEMNGLVSDGIVGPLTYEKLYKVYMCK